jgi:hypothetical protein
VYDECHCRSELELLPRWRTEDGVTRRLVTTATASLQRVQHARNLSGEEGAGCAPRAPPDSASRNTPLHFFARYDVPATGF